MLCIALWIWSVILPWTLLGTVTTIIAGILSIMYPAWDSKNKDSNGRPNKPRHEKWFYAWLIGLSALGGFWALFLPLALNQKFDGPNADGNQLRLHLLYITGGVLALTTLGETHRKNTVDREKAKVEKDNYEKSQAHQVEVLEEQQRQFNETIAKERERIEVDKAKNEQDHIRQVHAERHSRYTTAIEQLSSDKASIRLGGVYALIGLANEWLADNSLAKEDQYKEGQIIINNLCAYIRSPFSLAERHKELTLSYTKYQKNYQNNSQTLQSREEFAEDKALFQKEGEIRQAITDAIHTHLQGEGARGGLWSHFEYDFSNAIFFYNFNLDNTTFKKSVFFKGTTFTKSVTFNDTEFSNHVTFKEANFIGQVFFNKGSIFPKGVSFEDATFFDGVIFKATEFKFNIADIEEYVLSFDRTTFACSSDFAEVTFIQVKFDSYLTFRQATFDSDVSFIGGTTFKHGVSFEKANFIGNVNFGGAIFSDDDINFDEAQFAHGYYNVFENYQSQHQIEFDTHISPDGKSTFIPKGSRAFNPLLTKVNVSGNNVKGISVKGISANGAQQIHGKLTTSDWPRYSASNTQP